MTDTLKQIPFEVKIKNVGSLTGLAKINENIRLTGGYDEKDRQIMKARAISIIETMMAEAKLYPQTAENVGKAIGYFQNATSGLITGEEVLKYLRQLGEISTNTTPVQ